MYIINKFVINKFKIINLFIALIPLSIILGNLAININIFIIIILGLIIFGKKIFSIEEKIFQILIYLFFIFLIINTYINNYSKFEINYLFKENFIKSIFFLRFLIFFLVINKLFENNLFNLKYLFISSSFFSVSLAVDIIIQVNFGVNIFGNQIQLNRPSGFFNSELIAGGYLQKFILFFIFMFVSKTKNKNLILIILFSVFFIPIILTGNRMSSIIYFSSALLYFFINGKLKKIIYVILISSIFTFFIIKSPLGNNLENQFRTFFNQSKNIYITAPKLFYDNSSFDLQFESWEYLIHFNTGIQIWKTNKIFGHGLKSFRLNCNYDMNQTCNTHPHNYFIELMVDVGFVGLLIIYLIFILSLINFYQFNLHNNNKKIELITSVFFLLIFFEFFPLRSSGSFFTTGNSVFIFLILSIFINIKKIKNQILF